MRHRAQILLKANGIEGAFFKQDEWRNLLGSEEKARAAEQEIIKALRRGAATRPNKPKLKRETAGAQAPFFYAQLQRVIEAKMPDKAFPIQLVGIIRGGKVKEDEIKRSGIMKWLRMYQGKVTKAEVLDYLNSNPPSDVERLLDEVSAITNWKLKHVPDVLKGNKRFQTANDLSVALTGQGIIPFRSNADFHGLSYEGRIILNSRSRQPMAYIAAHEATHTIETTNPENYVKLKQIVVEHIADMDGLEKHYIKGFNYSVQELPDELTADVLAECMMDKSFWQKVRERSPELLKPILDALDRISRVAKEQFQVPGKYGIMQYMKDVEVMRERLAEEYGLYMKEVHAGSGRQATEQFGSAAAKAKGEGTESSRKIEEEAELFADELDKWSAGNLGADRIITVCSTTDVLRKLGADQLPIAITQRTLEKVVNPVGKGQGKHGLPLDLVKQLPEQLHDPVMVFDSKTRGNSLVVMTELEYEGKTVVAAIHLAKSYRKYMVNNVASVYPRAKDTNFVSWI